MVKALFILVAGTLFFAGLLTPWVYHGLYQVMGDSIWPFSRVFNRVAMVLALVFVLILRKHFLLSEAFDYLKAEKKGVAFKHLSLGVLLTLTSVALAVPLLIFWTGDLVWEPREASVFLRKAPKILLGAFIIGLIEEAFFRVLVLNSMRRYMGTLKAVFACTLLYAAVHFIAPIKSWKYEEFSWDIGFVYLSKLAGQFVHPSVPSSFFGLVLVGLILSWVILKYRSIYLCIGMHAGWVISVKGIKLLGSFNPALEIPSGRISQYFLVSLPVAWASILSVAILIWLVRKRIAVTTVTSA